MAEFLPVRTNEERGRANSTQSQERESEQTIMLDSTNDVISYLLPNRECHVVKRDRNCSPSVLLLLAILGRLHQLLFERALPR